MRIPWSLEEAVLLMDFYFKNGATFSIPNAEAERISNLLRIRAKKLNLSIDSTFRNVTGIKMQLGCIHSVVTNGKHGMPNASKLFYDTYDLYQKNNVQFNRILQQFYDKYID